MKRTLPLLFTIGVVSACAVQAQSPTPRESPQARPPAKQLKAKGSAAAIPAPARHPAPKSSEAAVHPRAPGGGHGRVWVNTESRVYHKEGSKFYGTTKEGKYMTEAEAIKAGYRPVGNVPIQPSPHRPHHGPGPNPTPNPGNKTENPTGSPTPTSPPGG